jgi:hypothetical protein
MAKVGQPPNSSLNYAGTGPINVDEYVSQGSREGSRLSKKKSSVA